MPNKHQTTFLSKKHGSLVLPTPNNVLLLMAEISCKPVEGTVVEIPLFIGFQHHPNGGWEWDFSHQLRTISTKNPSTLSRIHLLYQVCFPPKCGKLMAGSSEKLVPLNQKKQGEATNIAISSQNGLITPRFFNKEFHHPQMRLVTTGMSLRRGSFPGSCPSLPKI